MRFFSILVTGSLLCLAPFAAQAATITFTDTNYNINTYREAGFKVKALSGDWHGGGSYGDPAPSAYVDNPGGTLSFTRTNDGLFTFSSVDLSTAQNRTTVAYDFLGLLDGNVVFDQSGLYSRNAFRTVDSSFSDSSIDTLWITLVSLNSSDFNMDNVVLERVAAVTPEPSSLMLLGTGVLAAAGAVRRRLPTA